MHSSVPTASFVDENKTLNSVGFLDFNKRICKALPSALDDRAFVTSLYFIWVLVENSIDAFCPVSSSLLGANALTCLVRRLPTSWMGQ
ncbi:hypothetical protein EUGRSUZ_F00826 [Eucalyptus grandis]|uniref:Uncharacterized protein n=2 Tax=Eucalyptus grandis TaxID=71139 RepID=A0ACC3KCF8_EUCGR|nr:hypothetical protein EUGRSUZ_F00826 [Eucalyptus grandis]